MNNKVFRVAVIVVTGLVCTSIAMAQGEVYIYNQSKPKYASSNFMADNKPAGFDEKKVTAFIGVQDVTKLPNPLKALLGKPIKFATGDEGNQVAEYTTWASPKPIGRSGAPAPGTTSPITGDAEAGGTTANTSEGRSGGGAGDTTGGESKKPAATPAAPKGGTGGTTGGAALAQAETHIRADIRAGVGQIDDKFVGLNNKLGGFGLGVILNLLLAMAGFAMLAVLLWRSLFSGSKGTGLVPVGVPAGAASPTGDLSILVGRLDAIYKELKEGNQTGTRQALREELRVVLEGQQAVADKFRGYDDAQRENLKFVRDNMVALKTELAGGVSEIKGNVQEVRSQTQEIRSQGAALGPRLESITNDSVQMRSSLAVGIDSMRTELQNRVWAPGEAETPNLTAATAAVTARLTEGRDALRSSDAPAAAEYLSQCIREVDVIQKCSTIAQEKNWANADDLISFADPIRRIALDDVEPLALGVCGEAERMLQHLRRRVTLTLEKAGCYLVRPVPGTTRFDSEIHKTISNLNRSTSRPELGDVVCQRLQSGLFVKSESGVRNVLRQAEVGRFVFESGGVGTQSESRIVSSRPQTSVAPAADDKQSASADGTNRFPEPKPLEQIPVPKPQGSQETGSKLDALRRNSKE